MSGSTKFDSEFVVDIRPGLVSAFYFIFFDLVLISIVDTIMSRVMSYYYYNTAFEGRQLQLRSADIPGVTTFLIGDYRSRANVAALSIKLMFLAAIFTIDLKINAAEGRREDRLKLSAYFKFNVSDAFWEPRNETRKSSVAWRESHHCRTMGKDDITYYSIAFNLLDNNASKGNEVSRKSFHKDVEFIDYNSIQCLKTGEVAPNDVDVNARVLGCSKVKSSGCSYLESTTIHNHRTPNIPNHVNLYTNVFFREDPATYKVFEFEMPNLQESWSAYQNPFLTCIVAKFGPNLTHESEPERYNCLLIADYSIDNKRNGTLVEHWTLELTEKSHNKRQILKDNLIHLNRYYPGPVFEGKLDIGLQQRVLLLHRLWHMHSRSNWATLSGYLVSSAAAFTPKDMEITKLSKTMEQTIIPAYVLFLIVLVTVVTILGSVVVCFKFGFNYRPELNNIDRLALLAKERYSSSIDFIREDSSSVALSEAELGKRFYSLSPNRQTISTAETGSNDRSETSSTHDENPPHASQP